MIKSSLKLQSIALEVANCVDQLILEFPKGYDQKKEKVTAIGNRCIVSSLENVWYDYFQYNANEI